MARRRGGSGAAVADLDAAEERLYGAALKDFVATRGELAKELRAAGDPDAARSLSTRRKPSVALWAVNQIARRHADEVDVLLAAGEALRAAQGGDPAAFRDVVTTERRLVGALTDRAAGVLEEGGHAASEANLERVRRILQAASAASEEERERLRRGVLAEELAPAGFASAFAVLGLAEAPAAEPDVVAGRREKRAPRAAPGAGERAALRQAALAEARAAERHVRELQSEAEAVARGLDLQQRHLDMAEQDLRRSHGGVADAQAALLAAREQVSRAARARDALVRTVEQVQRRHDELSSAIAGAKEEAAARQAAAAALKSADPGARG